MFFIPILSAILFFTLLSFPFVPASLLSSFSGRYHRPLFPSPPFAARPLHPPRLADRAAPPFLSFLSLLHSFSASLPLPLCGGSGRGFIALWGFVAPCCFGERQYNPDDTIVRPKRYSLLIIHFNNSLSLASGFDPDKTPSNSPFRPENLIILTFPSPKICIYHFFVLSLHPISGRPLIH